MTKNELRRKAIGWLKTAMEEIGIKDIEEGKTNADVVEEAQNIIAALTDFEIIEIGNHLVQQFPDYLDCYKAYRKEFGSNAFYIMGGKQSCIDEATKRNDKEQEIKTITSTPPDSSKPTTKKISKIIGGTSLGLLIG